MEWTCVFILTRVLVLICRSTATYYMIELNQGVSYDVSFNICQSAYDDIPSTYKSFDMDDMNRCTMGIEGDVWLPIHKEWQYAEEDSSWSCDFEIDVHNGLPGCFLSSESEKSHAWKRKSGSTRSVNTGPRRAVQGLYYLYTEVSGAKPYQTYVLNSITLKENSYCLIFYYNMYGKDIGSLSINLTSMPSINEELWRKEGQQSNDQEWLHAFIDIPIRTQNSKIKIIGTRGNSFRGDIAIDDVRLKYGACRLYLDLFENYCGDIFYRSSGTILSPNYPLNYPSNIKCRWKIIVPVGDIIKLHVNFFSLQRPNPDCYDVLNVHDSDGNLIGSYCGNMMNLLQNRIQSTNNVMTLEFKADVSRTEVGFNISWTTETINCSSANIGMNNITHEYRSCKTYLRGVICSSDENNTDTICEYLPVRTTTANSGSTQPLDNNEGVPSTSVGIGVGVSVSILILAALVILTVILWRRRRRTKLPSNIDRQHGPFSVSAAIPIYQEHEVIYQMPSTNNLSQSQTDETIQHNYVTLLPDAEHNDNPIEGNIVADDAGLAYENCSLENKSADMSTDNQYYNLHLVGNVTNNPDDKSYDHISRNRRGHGDCDNENYEHLGINKNDGYDTGRHRTVDNTVSVYSDPAIIE